MKLYMRNGAVIKTADKNVIIHKSPDGEMTKLEWIGGLIPGEMALYVDLKEVQAVSVDISFGKWLLAHLTGRA